MANVGLPGLLVAVGVVAVGTVQGHFHVLGLDVADDLALDVHLAALFAHPVPAVTSLDEETARYQEIIA